MFFCGTLTLRDDNLRKNIIANSISPSNPHPDCEVYSKLVFENYWASFVNLTDFC
jgi:hypothetical protein